MKTYVTYGLGQFDRDKIHMNLDCVIGKPKSAWWGSPVDADFGWKQWCEMEEWLPKGASFEDYFSEENACYWTLDPKSRVLEISSGEDLLKFLKRSFIVVDPGCFYKQYAFNFRKIVTCGYAAVELLNPGLGHGIFTDIAMESLLYSWDCQSICVLDPSKIIVGGKANG